MISKITSTDGYLTYNKEIQKARQDLSLIYNMFRNANRLPFFDYFIKCKGIGYFPLNIIRDIVFAYYYTQLTCLTPCEHSYKNIIHFRDKIVKKMVRWFFVSKKYNIIDISWIIKF